MARKRKNFYKRYWLNPPSSENMASISVSVEECNYGCVIIRDCTRSVEIHSLYDRKLESFVKKIDLMIRVLGELRAECVERFEIEE